MDYEYYLPSKHRIFSKHRINRELLLDFFLVFSRMEYSLKAGGYIRPQEGQSTEIKIDWKKFTDELQGKLNFDENNTLHAAYLYFKNNLPKRQIYENGLRWEKREKRVNLTITEQSLKSLKAEAIPDEILKKLKSLKEKEPKEGKKFLAILKRTIGDEPTVKLKSSIMKYAEKSSDQTEEDFLIESVKTVRNNLFHGGKETIEMLTERDNKLIEYATLILAYVVSVHPIVKKAFDEIGPDPAMAIA